MRIDEIQKAGLDALVKSLGPDGMIRFLQQFDSGNTDYTKDIVQVIYPCLNELVANEVKNKDKRIEKYINSKGRIMIGWDEILEGGLAPNAVVMSWRGEEGGIQAVKMNHKVIMTPEMPCYFDHYQNQDTE